MDAAAALPMPDVGERLAPPCLATSGVSVVERLVRDVPETVWPHWQTLAEEASEANCFAEPWFVSAGLAAFAARDEVRLLEVWENGRLLGVLPLCIGRDYGRMRVRHVENWRHHHDFLGTPLVRAGREQAYWAAILGHLDAADWAPGFLHVTGLLEDGPVHRGLQAARACPIVHRSVRAALHSDLSPQAYYEHAVRKKKRKEIKRLESRLAELGPLACVTLVAPEDLPAWCDAFLALERSGWKGQGGTALACAPATEAFFRQALAGAAAAGRLEFLRLDLSGEPIAMLVNFLAPPGSFSFKIAFDEDFARFSPGVLLQIENLRMLARPDIAWMDSCAAENHPMIDSLWTERRAIVRCTIPLAGVRRGLTYKACRALETASCALRALKGKLA